MDMVLATVISATTNQLGIKCTKAKEQLRAYCLYCGRVVLIPKSVINCRLPIFLENGLCLHQPSRKNQNLTIFLMLEKEELLSQKALELRLVTLSEKGCALFINSYKNLGGPPLTRFSLPRIPIMKFVACEHASGGFQRQQGIPYSPTNANFS